MFLRKKAIRLAYSQPALRPLILPLLKRTAGRYISPEAMGFPANPNRDDGNTPFWDRLEPGGLADPAPWEKAEQKKKPSTEKGFPGESFVELQGFILKAITKEVQRTNRGFQVTIPKRKFDVRTTPKGYTVDGEIRVAPKDWKRGTTFPEEGVATLAFVVKRGIEKVKKKFPGDVRLTASLISKPGEMPVFSVKGEIRLGINMGTRRHYPTGIKGLPLKGGWSRSSTRGRDGI